jgi:hypothetical protein
MWILAVPPIWADELNPDGWRRELRLLLPPVRRKLLSFSFSLPLLGGRGGSVLVPSPGSSDLGRRATARVRELMIGEVAAMAGELEIGEVAAMAGELGPG